MKERPYEDFLDTPPPSEETFSAAEEEETPAYDEPVQPEEQRSEPDPSGVYKLPEPNGSYYRKLAISDISWRPLVKATALYMLIMLVCTAVSSPIGAGIGRLSAGAGAAASLVMSIGILFLASGLTAGLLTTFLQVRRKQPVTGLFGSMRMTVPVVRVSLRMLLYVGIWQFIPAAVAGAGYGMTSAGMEYGKYVQIAGLVLVIPALVFTIRQALRYALSYYLCVDRKLSPGECLKVSAGLMRGSLTRLLKLYLPFIGWILLLTLASSAFIVIPLFPVIITGNMSLVGAVAAAIILLLVVSGLSIPLIIYIRMTSTEFYEYRIGSPLGAVTDRDNKKAILIPLLAALLASVLAALLMMLPASRIPVSRYLGSGTQEAGTELDGTEQTGDFSGMTIDTTEEETAPSKKDALTPDKPDDVTPGVKDKTSTDYYIGRLTFLPPSGYSVDSKNADKSMKLRDGQKHTITISRDSHKTLKDFKKHNEGSKDAEYNGIKGCEFEKKNYNGSVIYMFACEHDGSLFTIEADKKEDLVTLLGTIHF